MNFKSKKHLILLAIVFGSILGLLFPSIFIILDINQLGEKVTFESVGFIIESQNIYSFSFIVFPLVFILVFYFYFTVLQNKNEIALANKKILEEQEKSAMNSKFASIGILSAGIGHEINNPLSVILMNAKFVKKDLEKLLIKDEKIHKKLDTQINAANRIAKIVKGLKSMAYTGSNENKEINLMDSMDTTIDFIEEIYKKHNIEILKNYPEQMLFVKGQSSKLQQVFLNFLSNAKDAIIEKGQAGEIRIDIQEQDNQIKVEIRDNGIGIDQENLEKIFDTFFTTKDENSGTGMGLSITLSILKDMNASVEVESTKEVGSVFRLTFPKVAEPKINTVVKDEDFKVDFSLLKDKKILFVEDEKDISDIMSDSLKEHGLNVKLAFNGIEALTYLKGFQPDLIVTDIQMPEMNGFELIQKITEIEYKSPIIISTGGGLAELVNKVDTKVVNFVLRKPYDDMELIKCIQDCLSKN